MVEQDKYKIHASVFNFELRIMSFSEQLLFAHIFSNITIGLSKRRWTEVTDKKSNFIVTD